MPVNHFDNNLFIDQSNIATMIYLKLFILLLIFCNLPSYALVHINADVGSMLSYSIFMSIIAYYIFAEKQMPVAHFILFGILFASISLMVSTQLSETFLVTFIKYFLFIIMASTVLKDVKNIEIYSVLLIGSLSVIYEAVFVTGIGGRYSGFYLNPNFAGCACILGYTFGLTIKQKKFKLIGQTLFSIAGLVTFSRTFLLIWVLINLLSVLISYKNVYRIIVCSMLFIVFLSLGDKLDFDAKRMNAFSSILGGKVDDDLKEGSRTETWALYYDKILNNPLWGNGYHTFSGVTVGTEVTGRFVINVGVHNTFLMILGEAGIFALLYFLWIYGYIFINGISFFKVNPSIFFLSFSLITFMLTNHNYFDNYLVLLTSLWLYHETYNLKNVVGTRELIFTNSAMNIKRTQNKNLLRDYHLN